MSTPSRPAEPTRVGETAALYLGNILYAIERCALSLEQEGKPTDAAFYRGIGRRLAEAHGDDKAAAAGPPDAADAASGREE